MATFVPVTDWQRAKELYDAGLLWWDKDQDSYEWYDPIRYAFSRHDLPEGVEYDLGVGYMSEE